MMHLPHVKTICRVFRVLLPMLSHFRRKSRRPVAKVACGNSTSANAPLQEIPHRLILRGPAVINTAIMQADFPSNASQLLIMARES